MMDVIHVFFEEDAIPLWEQHQEVKSKWRSSIYSILYGKNYRYAVHDRNASPTAASDPEMMEPPSDSRAVKPYIPPTNPEDLPGILDGPLG